MSAHQIITFGCRLNAHESQAMAEHARAAGFGPAVIVNTCAVTAEAVRQSTQAIRRARRERPEARLIVTGCAAQTEPERFAAMPEVDYVIGNAEKMRGETFVALAEGTAERVQVYDIMSVRKAAPYMITGFGSRARALVSIQNGCDHRCTFCVIPYGRGPSRSVPADEIIRQILALVEGGYREIVLTGVDITAYGADLPEEMTLGKLIRQILKQVPELARLRLSSIDTIEADFDLLAAFAEEDRLMPHLHLSLQAGDDLILKRMKRRHLRADAIGFCEAMRRLRPDIAFGADLIAGFPTETGDMFASTLDLVDECGLAHLHVFPFSPRPGTPAARMPQLDRQVIKERAALLRKKGAAVLHDHLEGFRGCDVEILLERPESGRIPQFSHMRLDSDHEPGAILRARVTGIRNGQLEGAVIA